MTKDKSIFTAEDFQGTYNHYQIEALAKYAELANAKIGTPVRVYGWEGSTYWRPLKDAANPTLEALLICIEPIEKKCVHEPHVTSGKLSTLEKFAHGYDPAVEVKTLPLYSPKCKHCGKSLKFSWVAE